MNTNLNSSFPPGHSLSGEGWAAIAGAIASAVVLIKKLLFARKAGKGDYLTRADFYEHMIALEERLSAVHLAVLEKLDANHREVLAALERQADRINALERGLARVDERTKN
jgi:hypothetical protein